MIQKIYVEPLSQAAQLLNALMVPCMYVLSGTFKEAPQRTHVWNHQTVCGRDIRYLSRNFMAHCKEDPHARGSHVLGFPLFHTPLFGGWREYAVLAPLDLDEEWHLGWCTWERAGVSQLVMRGAARALIGPSPVSFFAVSHETLKQIPVQEMARGRVGDRSIYSQIPLL